VQFIFLKVKFLFRITCTFLGLFSQRDNEPPTCERIRIRCQPLEDQENGSYTCTRRFRHGSQCRYFCFIFLLCLHFYYSYW